MLTNTRTLPQPSFRERLAKLKQNRVFELTVIAVIILSALEIGVKTFELPAVGISAMQLLDWAITLFFLVEISIRFMAEADKRAFFRSGWNLFDTAIVAVSLIPVDDAQMALLARLLRIFRVMRMISILPELRVLINSLLKALPQLGYVVLLMFIIFYIYAAMGSYLFEPVNPGLWGNIAVSMLTLFRVMTFEDWTDVMYETMAVYPMSWSFYVSFIFLTAFAFLNMVIGIVVGVMDEERNQTNERPDPGRQLADICEQMEKMRQQMSELSAQFEMRSIDPNATDANSKAAKGGTSNERR